MKYLISKITTYDSDENLYFTKVGTDEKDMPLHFICAGKTESESQERAKKLVSDLEKIEK